MNWAQERDGSVYGGRICECDHHIEDDPETGESWYISDGCTGHHWARWSLIEADIQEGGQEINSADPDREDVVGGNGAHLHIANALYLWEGGEFSDWAEQNGFPLTINGEVFEGWEGVEDALANFPCGPYDPRELQEGE